MFFCVTGEKVVNLSTLTLNRFEENLTVKTDKGTVVVADMVIPCTGLKINSSAYSNAFSKLLPILPSSLNLMQLWYWYFKFYLTLYIINFAVRELCVNE